MKHITLLSLLFFFAVKLSGQEYLIDFESAGIAAKIDTITVKNITTGETVVLTGDQALRLKSTSGRNTWEANYPNGDLTLFPNPMEDYSTLEFETPETGSVDVDLYNGTGLRLARVQRTLPPGRHSYQVSGINAGIYLVRVNSNGYVFVGKLVSNSSLSDRASLVYLNSVVNEDAAEMLKSAESLNSLGYTPGDKLLFTMKSGDYSTTITAIPDQDKSITGNFYDCVDMDNNIYPVVEIGTQVWMAANLKTTKYSDGSSIPQVTSAQWANLSTPAFCWRKNDESFKNPYGGLYNWHAVNSGKLCPSGWHVPSEEEWITMESYVGGTGVAGSRLKETGTSHWDSPNSYSDNNTGFSMVGGGYRTHDGGTDFEFGRSGYLWSASEYDAAKARYHGFGVGFARVDRGTSSKNTGFSVRCLLNSKGPIVNTAEASNITRSSATCQGFATCGPDSHITGSGFCWSINPNPDITSGMVACTPSPDGLFSALLTSLTQNTVYYVRAYARIDGKIIYGNIISFRTLQESGKLTDFDGNEYKTVTIGSQTWMAENLKTTHLRNGVAIPEAKKAGEWVTAASPAFSWRNNNMEGYKNPYGALYNWYAVNDENLCPAGWHAPSESEFKTLEQALGGRAVAGGALKEAGMAHWSDPNAGATNSSGFTMLPGGYRTGEGGASFYELGRSGYLWSSAGWQAEAVAYYWGFSKDAARTEQGISGMHTGFSVRCLKNDFVPEIKLPLFTTDTVTRITTFSATVQATLIADGGAPLTMKGFCWGTLENPDTSGFTLTGTGEAATMILDLNDLLPNTTYHVRAFGINTAGVGYANELVFRTKEIVYGSVTDHEGNQYKTVKIGTQNWMAENLRATTYTDGTAIPLVSDFNEWGRQTTPAYCWYNNSEEYKTPYGPLYNWYTATTGKICPAGWHIPTRDEWDKLMNYLGGRVVAGGKMKESGESHWNPQLAGATNSSGFTALPGGWRLSQSYETGPDAGFQALHETGTWLTATQFNVETIWNTALTSKYNSMMNGETSKMEGNSIRCLENDSERVYGTVADVDGNNYKTVQIGTQTWMAENLKTSKYKDGTPIAHVVSDSTWTHTIAPAYSWYDNEVANKDIYGGYYNWYTVQSDNLCPADWHLPTEDEWNVLSGYLGGNEAAGSKLKETGTLHWLIPNADATNESGFSAIGSGCRSSVGSFAELGKSGMFWTATEVKIQTLYYKSTRLNGGVFFNEQNGYSVRCVKNGTSGNVNIPRIKADSATSITPTSATIASTVIDNGGEPLKFQGICWGTNMNPDTSGSKIKLAGNLDEFTLDITSLTPGKWNYVRAFAINSAGIAYSNVLSIQTPDFDYGSLSDADGNKYKTIKIGTQNWMAENLKTTKYTDGTAIPHETTYNWKNLTTPAYGYYNDDPARYAATYGALYNGYTVQTGKLCPSGWHVPEAKDWSDLIAFVGGYTRPGDDLKEAGTSHWKSPNTGATNRTGFTALPGGWLTYPNQPELGEMGNFWSSTVTEPGASQWLILGYNVETIGTGSAQHFMGLSVRCMEDIDDPNATVPEITTDSVSLVGKYTAAVTGTIKSNGGATITKMGVCWSTGNNPDTTNFKLPGNTVSGSFTLNLTALVPNTVYYVRSFAVNGAGISYGNLLSFKTKHNGGNFITDIDGNEYETITIGTQTWMAENLKSTRLNDGTPIGKGNASNWASFNGPGYCWFNDDAATYANTYGAIYNGYVAASDKACPAGWHGAAKSEWDTLINYLGGGQTAGGKLKEAGTDHWLSPNKGADNTSGFTALPGGSRSSGGKGGDVGFTIPGYIGGWWTSTPSYPSTVWLKAMNSDNTDVGNGNGSMRSGNSIRCIMGDSKPPISRPRLVTREITDLAKTEAGSGGIITTDGDGFISSCGVCWSLESNPDTSDFKTNEGNRFEEYKSSLTGLMPDTVYHVRAYAINQAGLAYGNEVTFRTLPAVSYGSVVDVVGNTYRTVKIGTQEWMAENLKTHYYSDATPIPYMPDDSAWAAATSPAWSYLDEKIDFWKLYGSYYNFYAVQTDKLCPAGWRLPSDTDWETLVSNLGGQSVAGGKLKEIGTGHWTAPNAGATNEYGFTGIGAGLRSTVGPYFSVGEGEYYWSSTQPSIWTLNNENERLEHQIAFSENNGYHVRCMKDGGE